jgi:hypothetical protein
MDGCVNECMYVCMKNLSQKTDKVSNEVNLKWELYLTNGDQNKRYRSSCTIFFSVTPIHS